MPEELLGMHSACGRAKIVVLGYTDAGTGETRAWICRHPLEDYEELYAKSNTALLLLYYCFTTELQRLLLLLLKIVLRS